MNGFNSKCLWHVALQSAEVALYVREHRHGVQPVLLVSSIIALMYNLTHALLIKQTSPVTVTVLGEVKVLALLLLSAVLLGMPISI